MTYYIISTNSQNHFLWFEKPNRKTDITMIDMQFWFRKKNIIDE